MIFKLSLHKTRKLPFWGVTDRSIFSDVCKAGKEVRTSMETSYFLNSFLVASLALIFIARTNLSS